MTGATGFIGSHVARALVRGGHRVFALVREDCPSLERIADLRPDLEIVSGSVLQPLQLRERLAQIAPDVAIHLAWYAVPGRYLTAPENLAFLAATTELGRVLFESGCPRFVGAGTCFEYDVTRGYLSERVPPRPANLYAACKLGSFQVLEQLAALAEKSFAWVRFFYQYGPFEHEGRIVASVIRALLAGREAPVTLGEQVRDFLHVDDVAQAVVQVALQEIEGPVNIGSGVPVTIRQLVSAIGELCGRPELIKYGAVPYRPSDPMFVCADSSRLRSAAAWKPELDLVEGLRRTILWWKRRSERGSSESSR